MNRKRLEKYGIFVAILLVGLGLDQWSKWYASKRLANGRLEDPHTMTLRVPESADGQSLRDYLAVELSANDASELDRIAGNWVLGPDGAKIGAETKIEAGQLLEVVHRKVTVIPGFFEFEYAENRGAAFSFLAGSSAAFRLPILLGFSALALVFILYLLAGLRRDQRWMTIALSLVAAGAIGNLIDRVRLGYVIDFILWKWQTAFRWPNFNLADTFITVGVAIMLVCILFGTALLEDE